MTDLDLIRLVSDIHEEFPAFKLVMKDESKLMRFLAVLLKPLAPDFMKSFAITLGTTVYYPRGWSETTLYEVLRHERVHMRDSKKWSLLYYLTYSLLPLPFIVSGRAYWEFRGYTETLKVCWERAGKPLFDGPLIPERDLHWAISQFTSSSYGWMFPFVGVLEKAFRKASLRWV